MTSYRGRGILGREYPLSLDIPTALLQHRGSVSDEVMEWCEDNLMYPWVFVEQYSWRVQLTTDHEVNLVHFKLAWI